ncbi:FHIPEP family type III secretion protein [Treponema sp.]|uniref:FHIPEP family type III secretion protein n=1 Tax=Treponema sp. TaxID=166 RepID=UPI00339050DE|nr:hypothetical protein [Treponema sp.]
MTKLFFKIKKFLPLFMLITGLLLIYLPIPIRLIQFLLILNLIFSICLFLAKFSNKTLIAVHFSNLVKNFCIFNCALMIATIRTFLTITSLKEQIPLVLIIGQWICRENFVCGFFTTLMFCTSILLFCKLHVCRFQEVAARFCLDKINRDIFEIDQKIARKEITEGEGAVLRKEVRNKIDFYSSMDYSAKFLLGTIIALTALYIVAAAGGVAVGIINLKMYWKDALNRYIMLSSGYLVLFVLPLFLTSLGFKISKSE